MADKLLMAADKLTGSNLDADELMRSLVERLADKRMRATDLFKKIDTSGDGFIDSDELRTGLADMGFKATDAEFSVIMSRVSTTGGDVSLKEFDRAIKAAEKLPPRKKVEEVAIPKKKQGITAEDREEFRQIFCLFKQLTKTSDSEEILVPMDGTGHISVDELEQLLEGVGMKLRPDDLHHMIRDLDKDKNGDIDFEEFCDAMSKEIQVDHDPEEITKCFKAFARNAPEGYIRVEDLRNALTTYMHRDLSLADVNDLLSHYQDCFVRLPGVDYDLFNYQDYIDLMSPLERSAEGT